MVRTVIPFQAKETPPQDVEALRLVEAMTDVEEGAANAIGTAGDTWTQRELEAVWDAVGLLDAPDFAETRPQRVRWPVAVGIAAAVVLGLGVWFVAQRPVIYETKVGKRQAVVLADGSRVTLNTGSRIEVRGRKVDLMRGEALFEVAHRPDASPFDVRTDMAQVRVTGTRFTVRREETGTDVNLIEGRVEVRGERPGAQIVKLKAGQAVAVGRAGDLGPVHPADTAGVSDWLQGRLTFSRTPLKEAVAEMNRYSDRKLIVADARLSALRIDGEFEAGNTEALAQALHALYGVDTQVSEDGIRLRSGRD
ncbi:FecR family protein [Asticcacaulis excentricus]|uniref:Anti-FecI sigma factor, FecR n=1 Tax=Asticcacaulis excentricus (strain ATCC 15261 / DSM 4724 / KCTC 12464 / NCIMB 9791 / VKM B-1370 / CB 48) TaxID=573065 RepID=E8RVH2_ASTEC|nr:FecR domain-containing protein [Asticcacaulis excentricus]ADU15313.1 anti-FecI sigma factor, FecR [Asticcacaulis excentricus CB 48]